MMGKFVNVITFVLLAQYIFTRGLWFAFNETQSNNQQTSEKKYMEDLGTFKQVSF